MWINSPLGKWDQDALVAKALQDANRRRMLGEAYDANLTSRTSRLDYARATLRRELKRIHQAVDLVQPLLESVLIKAREQWHAS
jgi:DNA-binding transcriptional ArsR family regulator